MKTAIEWLVDELELDMFATDEEMEIIIKSKEMHKEQIIDAFELWRTGSGEKYYTQTFKQQEQ
jgi:hypothetical protein